MRGKTKTQPSMLALVSIESMVPAAHPLRRLKPHVERALVALSDTFDAMYSSRGRHSIPPEHLLKASVLMALFSVRSERQFCEQLRYNMLFRWFLDMDLTEEPFERTVFSKNRERLLEHDVARRFFEQVVAHAHAEGLMTDEHFSVDGTLIEAWGSAKSFRPKSDTDGDNNGFGDFKGTKRSNDTHESKTDPDAKLWRKGRGRESKLSYMGHALMENRNGLIADFEVTEASGYAERDAAIEMVDREQGRKKKRKARRKRRQRKTSRRRNRRTTVGADRGYDAREFVHRLRQREVVPHVAQKTHQRSAIDGRTTRHPGYRVSLRARLLIEKIFGWMKAVGGFRRSRYRGLPKTAAAGLMVAATYNLVRIASLKG